MFDQTDLLTALKLAFLDLAQSRALSWIREVDGDQDKAQELARIVAGEFTNLANMCATDRLEAVHPPIHHQMRRAK